MGVQWFGATGPADAAGQPVATFTLGTEAEIFNLNQQGRGEAVVKLQKADIVRAESCLGVSALA